MYDISIPGNFKEIEISYMKSTATFSVSAEQSLTSILFSSHLRAASKYSDLWQDIFRFKLSLILGSENEGVSRDLGALAGESEVGVRVSPQVEPGCKTMRE